MKLKNLMMAMLTVLLCSSMGMQAADKSYNLALAAFYAQTAPSLTEEDKNLIKEVGEGSIKQAEEYINRVGSEVAKQTLARLQKLDPHAPKSTE